MIKLVVIYTCSLQIHECTRGCRTMLMDPQVTPVTLRQNRNSDLTRCQQACVSDIYGNKLQASYI